MKTTLKLADDVAEELERLRRERGESLEKTVNYLLGVGLAALREKAALDRHAYRVKPVSLGEPSIRDIDNIAEVLAVAEGEAYS